MPPSGIVLGPMGNAPQVIAKDLDEVAGKQTAS